MTSEIALLLERAEASGCLRFDELREFAQQMQLSDAQVDELCDELDARGVRLAGDCSPVATVFRYDELVAATADTAGLLDGGPIRHRLLSPEEEIELARRVAAGDVAARNEMVSCNLRLVAAIARRYQGRGLALLDLVQEGILGLIGAVERFDWRRGFRLSTYATWAIHNAIRHAVDTQGRAIRIPADVTRKERELRQVEEELRQRLGRAPTDAEIAEEAGLSPRMLQALHSSRRTVVSLDDPVGDDDTTLVDLVAAEEGQVEETVEVSFDQHSLRRVLEGLTDQERRVLQLRYGIGSGESASLAEVGRRMGISAERVRQVERRALQRLALRREIQALRVTA